MKAKLFFYLILVLILQSCYGLKDLINEKALSNDNVNYKVSNNFFVTGLGNTSNLNLKEDKLRQDLSSLGYELTGVEYGDSWDKKRYIKNFSISKINLSKAEIEQECRKAIRWSIRGMPLPRVYFDDVNTAISKCEKCCKEELESSYYQKVTDGIMKRETFLKFFPNGKYSEYAKKDLEDMKNGKNIRDGVIDPMADLQKTVDIAGKAYDNSVVGQTIKEIGKNLPKSSTTANLNTENYEVLEQININRFEFTEENAQPRNGDERLYLSVGCNNYKHQLDKENDGFIVSLDKYTRNKDLSSWENEIDYKQFFQNDGGIVTISFYSSENIYTSLKLRFKNGGNYRIEVYPKK